MQAIKLSSKVTVFLSESGQMDWPVNQSALLRSPRRERIRRKFITYLGGNTKAEIMKILKELNFESYQIRKAKRLTGCKYEAKVYGLSWNVVLCVNHKHSFNDKVLS